MNARNQVLIIGGGFGGLYAAFALKNAPVQITLLDRRNFHLFQPLLYQVATGTLSPADIAVPLRILLRRQKNTRVYLADVVDIDVPGRRVLLRDGTSASYDTLIVAAGSEPNYFGHDDWRVYAPGLKTIEDATRMRSRVLLAFENAEREKDPDRLAGWLTFVVAGAGPTGVELAGALAEVAQKTLRDGFRHIRPARAKIMLVDAVDHVLPGYPMALRLKAEKALQRLGVIIRNNVRVTAIQPDAVVLGEGASAERIPTRTTLWTAGVRASPLAQSLSQATGVALDQGGRVRVLPDLSVPGHPEILVIGDLANPTMDPHTSLPGVAPVAMQQGRYVADLIIRRQRGESLAPFRYENPGSVATIGRNAAVANFGRIRISGFLAWVIWATVHVLKLMEFENRFLVILQWIWNYVTWKRTGLLITSPRSLPESPARSKAKENEHAIRP